MVSIRLSEGFLVYLVVGGAGKLERANFPSLLVAARGHRDLPFALAAKPCRSGRRRETDSTHIFLVMIYFLLRDYSILPKKELHSSFWVIK